MNIGYYDYEELAKAALASNATQTDIDSLGKWFELFGASDWNGECYTIDSKRNLFPVYVEVEPYEFEIVGYEIRY